MNYRQILQFVDSEKALQLLGIGYTQSGGYLDFDCPKCQAVSTARLKIYGETKNLFYCTACKQGGNILWLAENVKQIKGDELIDFITKATDSSKKITEELKLTYELQHNPYLEQKGLSKGICEFLGIGVPKGKTMLSGCATFTVFDEQGTKVAYYGIRMKDGSPVFHKTFNPEFYLYMYHTVKKEETIYFTTDMFECVKKIEQGIPAICNFGLPYLSNMQLSLLEDAQKIIFKVDNPIVNSIAVQLAHFYKNIFYRFEH